MISTAASMVFGALLVNLFSPGLVPVSRAAWSWGCTYYTDTKLSGMKYMEPGATDGPTCTDGQKLTCSCPASPCEGQNAALPSSLSCAGEGNDGCFKLHHTYGTPIAAHSAVAGRAKTGDTVNNACGAADVIKVYGNPDGLSMLVEWGAATEAILDKSGKPEDAHACQALCAANADCKFFTFNNQGANDPSYGYFSGLCILHKALSCDGMKYSNFHGAIAGPATCATTTTTTAEGVTDASFAQTSYRPISVTLGASLSAFLFA